MGNKLKKPRAWKERSAKVEHGDQGPPSATGAEGNHGGNREGTDGN